MISKYSYLKNKGEDRRHLGQEMNIIDPILRSKKLKIKLIEINNSITLCQY
jgi:hypothetical protein